jgi:hypothetical protein
MKRRDHDISVRNRFVELAISAIMLFGLSMVMVDKVFRQRHPGKGQREGKG